MNAVQVLRRAVLGFVAVLLLAAAAGAQGDPLPSWNEGPAKRALLEFVRDAADPASGRFVPPAERVAGFDQDGTLWVEQPLYPQIRFAIERLPATLRDRPELVAREPYRTALGGDLAAVARLPTSELKDLLIATLGGLSVEAYAAEAARWLATARHPRWQRPYTELVYQPMLELLRHLRAEGWRTYIVTGGGQDFVRVYAESVYGVPPEQVVGTAGATGFGYDAAGRPVLLEEPRLLLLDDGPGKPEGIQLMIGRRPHLAVGNSSGDRQMLEYVTAGAGARLGLLVLHDDAAREYAYGPAEGLPESRVGTFPQDLYDEATRHGWIVVRMQRDWRRVFAWEP